MAGDWDLRTIDAEVRPVSLDEILAEGNIRDFWKDDENSKQLLASVRSIGVVQPLVLVPLGRRANGHRWRLVAGFRRYTAACEAGLDAVPAVIRRGLSDAQVLELQLVENLQRLDMNPIEEAKAVRDLQVKTGLGQSELGHKIGRSSAWVSLRIGLLSLPEDVQELLAKGKLSGAHGNALIPYSDRNPSLIRRAVERAARLPLNNWYAELRRIMDEAPLSLTGPWSRDLCTCTCSCCSKGPHADVHRGDKALGYT